MAILSSLPLKNIVNITIESLTSPEDHYERYNLPFFL
jgi:hypothetical protein